MNNIIKCFIGVILSASGLVSQAQAAIAPATGVSADTEGQMSAVQVDVRKVSEQIQYRHGDCSWLPEVALQVGWPASQLEKLKQIVLRESGCCPNRLGGDKVDKDCNITGVSEWNHRSDSGLLQINGVHWKPDHAQYDGQICKRMKICTQEPLLVAETNLRAGKLLYDIAGWSPWTPIK
jgi:hypothetical protein